MGLARQQRLVLCRRAALFQTLGRQRRLRRRISRQGRTACRQQIALRQPGAADLSTGGARGAIPNSRGFQRRGAGRPRNLSGHAEKRRTLERGPRLHPSASDTRANLRVETKAHATRILFEGKRAVGVEYRQGKELRQLRARREVILSSGAFHTPQLLMLSGVGDGMMLAQHGITTTHHLPGVGQNLQDHPDFIFGYTSDNPNFTGISFSGLPRIFRAIGQYRRERRGPMTSNFAECGGFLKTRPGPRRARYPVAFRHGDGRRPRPQASLGSRLFLPRLPVAAKEPRHGLACAAPIQRGRPRSIRISSAIPEDLESMVAGYKTTQRLMETPAMKALQKKDMFTDERPHRRRHPRTCCAPVSNRLSPGRHLQDGRRRSDGGGRSEAEGARARRLARRRCVDHADADRRQHQRADHHDRREGRRT